jgi:hypothetical protein
MKLLRPPYNFIVSFLIMILGSLLGSYVNEWYFIICLAGIFYGNYTSELYKKGKLKEKDPKIKL